MWFYFIEFFGEEEFSESKENIGKFLRRMEVDVRGTAIVLMYLNKFSLGEREKLANNNYPLDNITLKNPIKIL